MSDIWMAIALVGIGAGSAVVCVLAGAWVMFKAMRAVPGEKFIGGVAKGQVFTIPEAAEAADFPEAEQEVLKKTESFLKVFGGGR